MKFDVFGTDAELLGRAPQGARGLKFKIIEKAESLEEVAPRKGRVG